MGFNLLLGARGKILMRNRHSYTALVILAAATDAILVWSIRGVLCCHLQHFTRQLEPAVFFFFHFLTRTQMSTHYHISNPLEAQCGVY